MHWMPSVGLEVRGDSPYRSMLEEDPIPLFVPDHLRGRKTRGDRRLAPCVDWFVVRPHWAVTLYGRTVQQILVLIG